PPGQGPPRAKIDARVVPQPALARAARHAVLHAVTDKSLRPAVFHADGNADDESSLGDAETFKNALIEIDVLGDTGKLATGHLKRGRVAEHWIAGMTVVYAVTMDGSGRCGHAMTPLTTSGEGLGREASVLPDTGTAVSYPSMNQYARS